MQIALIILKSGIELITMAEQLEEEPSCHMQDPYLIKGRWHTRTMATLYNRH